MEIRFRKMHGLGNDFVIIDARNQSIQLNKQKCLALSDRKTGIGYDQLILIEQTKNKSADAFMRIYNADGSQAGGCGNATRCVAKLLMKETQKKETTIETMAGLLKAKKDKNNLITVNMGAPKLSWNEIPLKEKADTLKLNLSIDNISNPTCVNMGNPHTIFFAQNLDEINLEIIGPQIETHEMFPEKTNVEIVKIISPTHLKIHTWERGTGITRACGTGACASLVAAVQHNLAERKAKTELKGGDLFIEWDQNNDILMTGPATTTIETIAGPQGLGGKVRVKSFTSKPEDMVCYGALYNEQGDKEFPIEIVGKSKGCLVVKIEGVGDRNEAEALKGTKLYVKRLCLSELSDGEYYYTDLEKLLVKSVEGAEIGLVSAIYNFGAGDVLEVKPSEGEAFMVPFQDEWVPEVDMVKGVVAIVDPRGTETEL